MIELRRIVLVVMFGLAGGSVGWLYFLLMRESLSYIVNGRGGIPKFVAFAALRAALFIAGLVAAFMVGSWLVLPYAAGFFVARLVIVRRARAGGTGTSAESAREEHNA